MSKNNPIVIVEDDEDDCEMLVEAFKEVGVVNQFRCFTNAPDAIEYLRSTVETPFIIISDINMPKINGLKFKSIINQDKEISQKRIPFVFLSTAKKNEFMEKAFKLSIQGYFEKPDDMESLTNIAKAIVEYWKHSKFQEAEVA